MFINLRKGHSSVYLKHPNVGGSIRADAFRAEVKDDVLTFSFKLLPLDDNETEDENNFHELDLQSVTVDDDYIVTDFTRFAESKSFSALHLNILSRGISFVFNCTGEPSKMDGLTFNIENKVS